MRIRAGKNVRALLVELDQAFEKFHSATAVLADKDCAFEKAVEVGADREGYKVTILGIAWRINKASKNEGEFKKGARR